LASFSHFRNSFKDIPLTDKYEKNVQTLKHVEYIGQVPKSRNILRTFFYLDKFGNFSTHQSTEDIPAKISNTHKNPIPRNSFKKRRNLLKKVHVY
jgi:hypothetical protein